MEFKRSDSSRGPLARKTSSASGSTPLRSNTPVKGGVASARGAATPSKKTAVPPIAPRTPQPSSARKKMKDKEEDAVVAAPKSNRSSTFERSNSKTGSKSAFKRSNTAVGLKKAETLKQNNRVSVYVRVRAFSEEENGAQRDSLAVNMENETVSVNVPKKGKFTFSFDGCFWSNDRECPSGKQPTSQEDVFDEIGRPLVENALAGYNAAVMAYGQTGSGKTYTAYGPVGSLGTPIEGLIPRVCNMIFARAATSVQKGVKYTVRASMLEVYLEEVFDLLNHRKQLTVRNDFKDNTFHVVGNKSVRVHNYNDIMMVLNKAEPLRTFAATNIHDHSSRAHTLFMLEIQTEFASGDLAPRCSSIVLADLAGCERIKLAGTEEGIAFEQARNINLSLLALGSCIEAVANRGGDNVRSIPEFRNSTLTKLLKDYIGGNSISTMIVTISPGAHDANLSVQTLRFGDRAKQITTHAKVNTVRHEDLTHDDKELSDALRDEYLRKKEALYAEYQLQSTIEKLLARIAELEGKLRDCTDDELVLHLSTEIDTLQKTLADADYQIGIQRQILYGEFLLLEDQLREQNTRMQQMKEEHEEALENLLGEESGRYEDMKRSYECRIREAQQQGQAQLDEANGEIEALKKMVADLQVRLRAKEDECEQLKRNLTDLQEKYDTEMANANNTQRSLEEQLDAVRGVLAQAESDATAAQRAAVKEREDLQHVIEGLRQVIVTKETAISTSSSEHAQAVQTLNEQVEQLKARQASTQEEAAVVSRSLQNTQQQLKSSAEETSVKVAKLSDELHTKAATIAALEAKLQTVEEQLQEAEATAQNTQCALQDAENELQKTEANLTAKIEDTREKHEKTCIKLEHTETKLEEIEGQLEETQGKLQERGDAADNLSAELAALQQRHQEDCAAASQREATLKNEVHENEILLDETAKKLEETEEALENNNERLQETEKKLEDTEATLQDTAARLQTTEGKLEDTEATLDETNERLQETEKKLEDTEATLQDTAARLQATEGKLEDTEARLEEVESQLEETQGKLQERGDAADNLSAELEALQQRHQEDCAAASQREADLQNQVQETEATLQDTAARLQTTEGQLEETEGELEETRAQLGEQIAGLECALAETQGISSAKDVYIADFTEYVRGSYAVTVEGLTAMRDEALGGIMKQSEAGLNAAASDATREVEEWQGLCEVAEQEARDAAARFDALRFILGKIDNDVKEATTEIDDQERRTRMTRFSRMKSPSSSRPELGELPTNREKSTSKARSVSRALMMEF